MLMVDQVMKAMEPHDPWMCTYYNEVRKLKEKFKGFELHHIYKNFNTEVDELSTIVSGRKLVPDGIFASELYEPSVKIKQTEEELDKIADDQLTPVTQARRLVATTD
jgi:hypothetical protein